MSETEKRHAPMMLTSDLALRFDPAYEKIARRYHASPRELADAFAKAWYKLLHRDMGPITRHRGPRVAPPQIWQDPVPPRSHPLVTNDDVERLKKEILASKLTGAQLVSVAWQSASSFRSTDKRGGANGARIRLAPQNRWEANEPAELASILGTLEAIRSSFDRPISLADLIVLGGCAAIERAARAAGFEISVPFSPGRTDASVEQTDVASFAVLEPKADGFRNYVRAGEDARPEALLLERADMLSLSAAEMTVLVGGMRVLGANFAGARHGVFTDRVGTLSNDFFVALLDTETTWQPAAQRGVYEGRDASGGVKWTATDVELVFGSHSELRAIAEVYASDDAAESFVRDFVSAWEKVMNLDRYDLR